MNITCVIFDFDGTLFDSMFIWDRVGETYLRSLGKEPKPSLREDIRTLSLYQAACYLRKEYDLTLSAEEIMGGINRIIEGFYIHQVLPKPGIPDFLKTLQEKGVPMCIATATDRYLIEAALDRYGLQPYFDAVFTCGEVGHGKDEPVIYQKAMAHFGAGRENTVIFEDAIHAVETAKADGFVVAAVFDDSEKQQDRLRDLADCYITGFEPAEAVWNLVSSL